MNVQQQLLNPVCVLIWDRRRHSSIQFNKLVLAESRGTMELKVD